MMNAFALIFIIGCICAHPPPAHILAVATATRHPTRTEMSPCWFVRAASACSRQSREQGRGDVGWGCHLLSTDSVVWVFRDL